MDISSRDSNKRGKLEFKTHPFSWDSEEDDKKDVPLYMWLKMDSRLRPKDDPEKPSGVNKNWFIDMKPDEDWDLVRDYLKSKSNAVDVATIEKRKYSTITTTDYTYEAQKKDEKEIRNR